jgi:hypothetical protein
LEEVVELVDVLHSLILLSCRTLYCPSISWSNRLCKNLCSLRSCSRCVNVFLSLSSKVYKIKTNSWLIQWLIKHNYTNYFKYQSH